MGVPPEPAEDGAACAADADVIAAPRSGVGFAEIGRFERVQRRALKMLKG